jgi:arsenite/tail-anchored protein-transporting ATPase
LFEEEMVGQELLEELCREVYGENDPQAILHADEPMRVRMGDKGQMILELRLPYTEDRFDLARKDDELIVTVGSYRRSILLPQSLRRRQVVDAAFEGPVLQIAFGEDG